MKLSNNFSLEELIASKSYPNLVKYPSIFIISILQLLCLLVLQPLRDRLGTAVHILSGWRNRVLNEKVGGVKNSVHQIFYQGKFLGVAVDFHCKRMAKAAKILWEELPVSTIIVYPGRGFIHTDIRISRKEKKLYVCYEGLIKRYKEIQITDKTNWSDLIKGKV
jgi:hypothetical protein